MAGDSQALKSLDSLLTTTITLLGSLKAVASEVHRAPETVASDGTTSSPSNNGQTSSQQPAVNALALARDSASLIHAHATKISLLSINDPFSPSAISKVIREVAAGPVPGLAAAVQACDPRLYTALYRRELAWWAQQVFSGLVELLQTVPRDGKVLAGGEKGGASKKENVAATGILWSGCDRVTKLAGGGVGSFFVDKVEEWRDTLKDVMEELREWGEDEGDDDDDDDDHDDNADAEAASDAGDPDHMPEDSHGSAQAMLDELMSSQRAIPSSDPDGIRPRLESSLKRQRLVVLLYQAVQKRRMKKLPVLPPVSDPSVDQEKQPPSPVATVPQRLDQAAVVLQRLPDRFGDLAEAFYELQPGPIDAAMEQCFSDACAASELLGQTWEGGADEFTEWTNKFQAEIR